ncbi:MAG TPA: LytTR family DNA-binding domain-containing protein [Mucilaginibacter sp.]|jgi:DNA-binding LytR/AlgR family response regulator
MTLNCIAVDDEPIALDLVVSYINRTPFLKLIDKCSNAVTALKVINDHPEVKLIFLDIRMADLSGIELARIIEQSDKRKDLRTIFTTAYDQYALESYKVAALDYLLKPFNYVDFSKAATKALEYFEAIQNPQPISQAAPLSSPVQKEYIYLKVDYHLVKINIHDILYIEGLKDYVKLYLQNEPKPLLTLTSLKSLEEKLSPDSFLRLHRSFIVSLDHVKAVTKNSVQIGQTIIHVTEQYKEVFQKFLNKWV